MIGLRVYPSAAHCAATNGTRATLECLLNWGVNLWTPTEKGDYPLHDAAYAGHVGKNEIIVNVYYYLTLLTSNG